MNGYKLLVVEDDVELLSLLIKLAEDRGYDASGTCNPVEVMPRVRATLPAVVLLDLHMPHVNGRELLPRIAGEPGAPAVIVMSGYVDDHAYELCRACGADIVHKPFEPDDLFRRIDAAARLGRAR